MRSTFRRAFGRSRALAFVFLALVGLATMVRPAHAAAPFTAGNLVVYRVGTGSSTLTNAATAVFLDEYTQAGASVQSIPIPTTAAGANKSLTASGSAGSEGLLTRSTNAQYLLLTGYDAVTGTAGVASTASATTNRVVGRIDKAGTIDTTTALTNVYTGNNVRSAVSTNGTDIWTSGVSGGTAYTTLGATTAIQLSSTVTNTRQVNIFDNQLYLSSSSGTLRVAYVGSPPPPTTGSQTIANLPNYPTTGSPYAFLMADLSTADTGGIDTLYVADDTAGKIQKYNLFSGAWTANGTISAPGITGLTGIVSSGTVQLFATSPTKIYTYTDTSLTGSVGNLGTATAISTAATNTAMRGVALTPDTLTLARQPLNQTINAGSSASLTVTVAGSNLSYQWYQGATGVTTTPIAGATSSTYAPTLNTAGTFSYWVRVTSNGQTVDSLAATVTVNAVANTPPTISAPSPSPLSGVVADPTDPGATTGVTLTVNDAETAPGSLSVTASSSNTAVVPNANIVITGTGGTRTAKITPTGVGYSTITFTVTDGGGSTATTTLNYAASKASATPSTSRYYTGTSDASTAIDVGGGYMVVGDDENNVLRIYSRTDSGAPVATFDFTSSLNLTRDSANPEIDIEAAARVGSRIYWTGSQSNNKNGKARPNRNTVFATDVSGSGAATTLSIVGRYDYLRDDIIAWDQNNGHGKGVNYYGLAASAYAASSGGKIPETADGSGYNIEGLEFAPGSSTTAYVGFRAPISPVTNRTKALIVPVTNYSTLVTDVLPASLPQGTATFGAPIELDLGGRGIREMRKNSSDQYVIIAGPADEATDTAPKDFRLYTWDGVAGHQPTLRPSVLKAFETGELQGSFESIVDVPAPLTDASSVQLVRDSGDAIWYGDAIAAKDLTTPAFKKFRSDTVTLASPAYGGPVLSADFTPSSITRGSASVLTITMRNPNPPGQSLSGIIFTITLPTQISFGSPVLLNNTCGGSVVPSGQDLNVSGATLDGNETCTISVAVTSSTVGRPYYLTGSNYSSTQSGPFSATLNGSLTVTAAPTVTQPGAQLVYGQPDYDSNAANNPAPPINNLSARSLNTPSGIATDAGGVYIADNLNNRVLHYPYGSLVADRVYGQNGDFTTAIANSGLADLSSPNVVIPDPIGGIFISDSGNTRVLHFSGTSTTADKVFADVNAGALAADSGGGLYITDTTNGSVYHYPASVSGTNITTASADGSYTGLATPYGIALDPTGGLFIADTSNNRVLHYPASATGLNIPTSNADRIYGQPDATSTTGATTRIGLLYPDGIRADALGGLYVADELNNRIVYYAPWQVNTSVSPALTDPVANIPALWVYGQPDFTSATSGTSQTALYFPTDVGIAPNGDLYVADLGNNRGLVYPANASAPNASLTVTPTGNVPRGSILNYTLTLTNPSSTKSITGINIADPIAPGKTYVIPGSVIVNGYAKTGADPITLGILLPNSSLTITFQVGIYASLADGTDITTTVTYNYLNNGTQTGSVTQTGTVTVQGGANPLAAHISYVRVSPVGSTRDVSVEWAAARESRALGYDIYAGGKKLNAHIITAHSLTGAADGIYSATITLPAGTTSITLVDVEAGGKRTEHGGYKVGTTTGERPTYEAAPTVSSNAPASTPAAPLRLRRSDVALGIGQDGIYHLTVEGLLVQGIDLRGTNPARLALLADGHNVGLYVKSAKPGKFQAGDWIEFVANARDDFYNSARSYVLTANPKGRVAHLKEAPSISLAPKPGDPAATFVSRNLPGRGYYWISAPADSDGWEWALLENDVPQLADQNVTFDLPGLYNSDNFGNQTVTLTLRLRGWGGYDSVSPDHHVIAETAGVTGDVKFDGDNRATLSLSIPASALKAGGNVLRLRTPGDMGVEFDTMIVESLDVAYPQATALPAALRRVVSVRAYTRPSALATSISKQVGSKLDYVIIAHSDFVAGVAPIARQHRAEGLRVAVVAANAIYDSYSDGAVDPAAIQKFVADMRAKRGLKYVLLVGADSIDPRGYVAGDNPSFIPAWHALDSQGTRTPSDGRYADTDSDGLPDVALGRLPARNTDELAAMVAKSVGFAQSSTAAPAATFVADPTDPTFAQMAKTDIAALPKSAKSTLLTWQPGSRNAARDQIVTQWQRGSRIVTYTGHSNDDVWADESVLTLKVAERLVGSKPALVTVWGCWAALYDRATGTGLSQALLTMNGGAAAMIASTTEVSSEEYAPASRAFFGALYAGGAPQRIGDAFLSAKRAALAGHPEWTDLNAGLTLLGDPAARI